MLDSAIRIDRPSSVIAAIPSLTAGMIAGASPSKGSSSRSRSGSSASAPALVRRLVAFPAPFRPTSQPASRGPTASDTDRTMWRAWMNTSTASTVTMARPSPRPGAPADDRVDDAPVGLDRGRRAVGEHAPLVEGDDPVGVAEDDVHVVLDLDNRRAADPPGGRDHGLHDRRLVRRAHAGRRLG